MASPIDQSFQVYCNAVQQSSSLIQYILLCETYNKIEPLLTTDFTVG